MFNSTVIDYVAISLRTLGHFSTQTTRSVLDLVSYILAWFTLTCFLLELCYMAWVVNWLGGMDDRKMTAMEKDTREVMLDGLNEESIRMSWFVRNYNLLYLLRYFVFMCFLLGLQYLQISQVLFSFILMISFTILTIYYQLTHKVFDTTISSVTTVIQECSIAVVLILVNTFCVDNFERFLNQRAKTILVVVFIILVVLNIAVEVLSAGSSLLQLCTKSHGKVDSSDMKGTQDEIGKVFDIGGLEARGIKGLDEMNQEDFMENRREINVSLNMNGRVVGNHQKSKIMGKGRKKGRRGGRKRSRYPISKKKSRKNWGKTNGL